MRFLKNVNLTSLNSHECRSRANLTAQMVLHGFVDDIFEIGIYAFAGLFRFSGNLEVQCGVDA